MAFMLNKKITIPDDFADKNCCLVSYQMPLLPHCFVLCANDQSEKLDDSILLPFFLEQAKKLASQHGKDPDGFVFCFSGNAVRKKSNFHVHLFLVNKRWQKAVVYSLLATKNWGQMFYEMVKK